METSTTGTWGEKLPKNPEFVVLYWPLWGNYLLWLTPPPKGYQRSGTEELLWWNLNLSWLHFMINFLYYISSHWLPVKTSWNSQNNIGDMLWCIVLQVYGNYTGRILKCYVKLDTRGFLWIHISTIWVLQCRWTHKCYYRMVHWCFMAAVGDALGYGVSVIRLSFPTHYFLTSRVASMQCF